MGDEGPWRPRVGREASRLIDQTAVLTRAKETPAAILGPGTHMTQEERVRSRVKWPIERGNQRVRGRAVSFTPSMAKAGYRR
jgi:hypothetical protein